MPISRPLLIALVAAVVAAVGFYATQGGRESSDPSASEVVTPPPAPSPTPGQDARPAQDQRSARASKSAASAAKAGSESSRREPRAREPRAEGVPISVQRALDARKLVVVFFYEPGSADDRATARSVNALRSRPGVAVFGDPIGRVGKYRGLINGLGVSQAPAVVIVSKGRTARVIQGYVDPATLAQDVADAR
jgi:hypothetical protein